MFHATLSSLKQAAVRTTNNSIRYQVFTEDVIFAFLAVAREPGCLDIGLVASGTC